MCARVSSARSRRSSASNGESIWPWAAALGGAALVRTLVGLAVLGRMPMVSDARDYFALGVRIATGTANEAFYYPPGESALLSCVFRMFGPSVVAGRVLTIAIGVGTVALAMLIARELAGERALRWAGCLGALYAPSVLLCGQTYSQHLAAFCLAALAYFGLQAFRGAGMHHFAFAGLALGIGCVTRPSMASVAPVLVLASLWAARRRTYPPGRLAVGVVVAGCLALGSVAPVLLHNARAGAGYTISTNNERNLFLGNNPYTPDTKTSHLGQRSLDELPPATRSYLESFYARPDTRAAMRREAFSYMVNHPVRTLWRTLNRTTAFWGFDYLASREIQKWGALSQRAEWSLLALEAGSSCCVMALALVTLFCLPGASRGPCGVWLLCLSLAYQAPYCIAFSGGTYHFPVMPLVIALAAVTLAEFEEARRRFITSRAGYTAIGAFVLLQAQYAYSVLTMTK
jgi:4-amino-4-deoxy-L-arabinose transferase-like glycosyltransferase